MTNNDYYIYIYLNDCKPGIWNFQDIIFNHQPFYVGRGRGRRINDHLSPASRAKKSHKSNTINHIINNIGTYPTHYKIFENLSLSESSLLEEKIIRHFGRVDIKTGILTNQTDGGDGTKNCPTSSECREKIQLSKIGKMIGGDNTNSKKVLQFDLDGNLIREWNYLNEINKEIRISISKISMCCHGRKESHGGFKWKFKDKEIKTIEMKHENNTNYERRDRKVVYQYDLDGNFIQSYESRCQALYSLDKSVLKNMSKCCKGKFKQCGGFQWKNEFLGDRISPVLDIIKPHKRAIHQYSLDGVFIKTYDSVNSVKRLLNINNSALCADGKYSQAGGFIWKWDLNLNNT